MGRQGTTECPVSWDRREEFLNGGMDRDDPKMLNGARSGTRTHIPFRMRDFKSLASTGFAIRAERKKAQPRKRLRLRNAMEAEVGIEPAYADLQSAA